MKKLTVFYMEGCPYCRNAKKAFAELKEENPDFNRVPVEWIDENREPERTEGFDYYYVPTVFCEGRKLYEAHPGDDFTHIRGQIRNALEAAV